MIKNVLETMIKNKVMIKNNIIRNDSYNKRIR